MNIPTIGPMLASPPKPTDKIEHLAGTHTFDLKVR